MKPFLINKGWLGNSDMMLRGDNKTITDDKLLAKLFTEYYINITDQCRTVRWLEDFDKTLISFT